MFSVRIELIGGSREAFFSTTVIALTEEEAKETALRDAYWLFSKRVNFTFSVVEVVRL